MEKAKDIMTTEVVTLSRDTSVEEALEVLLENEIAGIPVVDDDMTLVGIVTEKDLLALFYGPQEVKGKKVGDYMTQPAVHFEEDESLAEICECLLDVTFRRVPVTRQGKVVGVVSRPDVLRCILRRAGRDVDLAPRNRRREKAKT
ncbi:MAG TPA: CBS domain-containing protein [Sedimentisphaerales bacterium]|nr:CBS domain-containing protein [Sedimentisphaerales bacterium]